MAYWQNGKLYLHGSTQSVMRTVASVAQWVGVEPEQVVLISEYTGGGFGSKIPGTLTMAVPALLAKKIGAPVMMRISREEEHFVGRCRPSLLARVRAGFRKDGRVTAVDMFVVQDAGPYEDQFDLEAAPLMCSLAYQPAAMRFRGLSVLTNTPPPTSQRSPGGMQQNAIMEPLLAKAAHRLGLDPVALHRAQRTRRQGADGAARTKMANAATSPVRSSARPSTAASSCSSGMNAKRAAASALVPKRVASASRSVHSSADIRLDTTA
jgi:CO/xanthine dehydrogenase Mo-binding subunit